MQLIYCTEVSLFFNNRCLSKSRDHGK